MAKLPVAVPEIVRQFGPTLNRVPAGGWVASEEEDRMVKTHCCFCGQQCGIQLRVRNNKVVGWEPWEDFPFNRGMLCPKGVKRYLQGNHPDRLLDPLMRTADGYSDTVSAGNGLFTLLGFMGMYALMSIVFLFLIGHEIRHGPVLLAEPAAESSQGARITPETGGY